MKKNIHFSWIVEWSGNCVAGFNLAIHAERFANDRAKFCDGENVKLWDNNNLCYLEASEWRD